MRFLSIRGTLSAALLLLAMAPPAHAGMSSEEREATFWKVAVIDFAGKTPGKVDGATAGVRVAASLRNSKRFHVIDPRTVRGAARKLKIDVKTGELSESDAERLCKQLDIDGVFAGKIDGTALTISLYSGSSGRLFSRYRFSITPQFPLREAAGVAKAYTSRLPYDGLVVSVRRDLALINLGTANGIGNGSRVYAFEFESMARDDDGVVRGGNRKVIAELEVVRSEQHGAWVRPLKGEMPEMFVKISLRPVTGAAELKPVEKDVAVGTPWLGFEIAGDVGFLFKSYELTGTGSKFSSSTTLFPAPGLSAQWFPKQAFGVGGSVRHGFIPFRRPEGTGPSRSVETYQGSVDTIILEGKARKVFATGAFAGGSIAATGGAFYSRFTVEEQDPLVLTSDSYLGPIIGGEAYIPMMDSVSLHSRLGVVPYAIVTETPKDNGNGSAFGVVGKVGLDYHINDKLFLSLDYGADSFQVAFPKDGGSRGLQNPKSSDLYHGVTVTLGWRSYR